MKCVLFCHAFSSCWNNGNAHFLRGVARELQSLGHEVIVYEPIDGWSRLNALRDGGAAPLAEIPALFGGIGVHQYDDTLDLDRALEDAGLVLIHEWNSPDLIAGIGDRRARGAPFTLLFHDTHHRAVTAPSELAAFDISGFDGVLVFGEALRQTYLRLGWADRVFTWHEGADVALYKPLPHIARSEDVVWIGNWGDGERAAELDEFLIRPVSELRLRATIYGVRYPDSALSTIRQARIAFGGWLPAHRAPEAFARARATIHVPRGPYVRALPGIPTIRMFEAMACGIPIVSAPWDDAEGLFPDGSYLRVANGAQMTQALDVLLNDPDLAAAMARTGLRTILEHHTCRHRVLELLEIVARLRGCDAAAQNSPAHEGAVA